MPKKRSLDFQLTLRLSKKRRAPCCSEKPNCNHRNPTFDNYNYNYNITHFNHREGKGKKGFPFCCYYFIVSTVVFF